MEMPFFSSGKPRDLTVEGRWSMPQILFCVSEDELEWLATGGFTRD